MPDKELAERMRAGEGGGWKRPGALEGRGRRGPEGGQPACNRACTTSPLLRFAAECSAVLPSWPRAQQAAQVKSRQHTLVDLQRSAADTGISGWGGQERRDRTRNHSLIQCRPGGACTGSMEGSWLDRRSRM
eukprot:1334128-Rhodomonas_salina.2